MNKRVIELIEAEYEDKLIIIDYENMNEEFGYVEYLQSKEFNVVYYDDVEEFRYCFESEIKRSERKWAVIIQKDIYIPYDMREMAHLVELSMASIYDKLDSNALKQYDLNYGILSIAVEEIYQDELSYKETVELFNSYEKNWRYVEVYCQQLITMINKILSISDKTYVEWNTIAKLKAKINYYHAMHNKKVDFKFIDDEFKAFIIKSYGTLSSEVNRSYPVLVTNVMNFLEGNEKVALIIFDGMSMFDFEIISKEIGDFKYDYDCSYAIIPTTTSISRQSMLAGKFPIELEKPFSLEKEEKEFYKAAKKAGFDDKQIAYERGYDFHRSPFCKFLSVIINDIDDLSHNQLQGKIGMLSDVKHLAKTGKIQTLFKELISEGFSVYITSDHGNTECIGKGRPKGIGIDVETRSNRMMILKDFAEKNKYIDEGTFEYPGYYLDKQYDYLICESGESYDIKGSSVLTHGGISIDEVIVPFIKIREVKHV